jgi:hypothetical protein
VIDIPPLALLTAFLLGFALARIGERRRVAVALNAIRLERETPDPREQYRLARMAEWRRTGRMVPLGRSGR